MKGRLTIPLAIIAGALVIAAAVYIVFYHAPAPTGAADPSAMRPIDATDHILGNPAAPVVFVEYSDIDSPFGKNFEATMESIVGAYGAQGKVALVYRDLPIIATDPNAENDAEAAECVASLGGDSKFFRFIDLLNAAAPGTEQFDPSGYPDVIQSLGLDAGAFTSCMSAHTYANKVASDAKNAIAAGATGAPYTLMLVKGSTSVPISGALSYTQMKELVDAVLAKIP